ncbi:CaiB/BaiF CoA transferase family protein [Solirubrobacter ginsenosidimutans]|nr:CoA transferase [Solirubrobacter ginsenosidimutans]
MRVLDGIRIVDFTRHMAGPFATLVLADHGADVIKVESLEGDSSRTGGADKLGDQSALFLLWNRGKRSLSIDMRTAEGKALVLDLIREADVLVENYRPGVADRIGIGYAAMAELNPRLVYCSVSAFGPQAALRDAPGTDPVVQATSGIVSLTGERGRDGVLVGAPIADFTGAMYAVQAILLALLARERTGRGQHVEVPMLFGVLSMLTTRLGTYWASGEDPERFGSAHAVHVPYGAYRTADGQAMAGTYGGESWPKFARAIGLPELLEDPRFATGALRREHRDALAAIIEPVFAQRTTEDWRARFAAEGALFAPVLTLSEILSHPQVEEAGLVQTLQHPTAGAIPQIGPPISMSETPPAIDRHPPLLGEHTDEVLREAGCDDATIARLRAAGVVR